MTDYRSVCEEAARAGGRVLLNWRGRFRVREKGPADLVTDADLNSQQEIQQIIAARFPDHAFLGEEQPADVSLDCEHLWVVDPLDGTTNYVHGMPNYSVSVAYCQAGEVVAGAIYDPTMDECFSATAGQGARLNGHKIQVSDVKTMSDSLIAVSLPPTVSAKSPILADFQRVLLSAQAIRRMGSAALNLAYVAAGRLDAYWSTSTRIWDIAAGELLVREAGGVVSAPEGGPLNLASGRLIAASCEALRGEVCNVVNQ